MLGNENLDLEDILGKIEVLIESSQRTEGFPQSVLQFFGDELKCQWVVFWKVESTLLKLDNIWCASEINAPQLEEDTRKRSFSLGEGMPGKIWRLEKSAKSSDITKDMALPRSLKASAEGFSEGIWFPIFRHQTVYGVIEMLRVRNLNNSNNFLSFLEKLGRQVGDLIH